MTARRRPWVHAPAIAAAFVLAAVPVHAGAAERPALMLEGTVVTMDDAHRVIPAGRVLVRDGAVVAVWSGPRLPRGVDVRGARIIRAGPRGLIFPGLINLHDHPEYDVLPLWLSRDQYDNRYQWSLPSSSPKDYLRLVKAPHDVLLPDALALEKESIIHAEARAALGGETAIQGEPHIAGANALMVRSVDGSNFGRTAISRVSSVENADFAKSGAAALRAQMAKGLVDAWIVHLAEGVRDGDRVASDAVSSRHEFATIRKLGLLNESTVIVHGAALERADFAAMRAAAQASTFIAVDGLGAKLVWSPLSNLLLYGHTTDVYEALQAGVTVSLSTDWAPSGSRTLLDELKVADIALHDPRIRGKERSKVPALASDAALDRLLADMVTRNPAKTLRWHDVGSIAPGKRADLLVLRGGRGHGGHPARDTPYRRLIDAQTADVRLVLVDGDAVAGDPDAVRAVAGRRVQLVRDTSGCIVKAIAFRASAIAPAPDADLAASERRLGEALRALGGDGAQPGSGPAAPDATFSFLRMRWNGGRNAAMTDAAFRDTVLAPRYGRVAGRLNLERVDLDPLLGRAPAVTFDKVGGRIRPHLASTATRRCGAAQVR